MSQSCPCPLHGKRDLQMGFPVLRGEIFLDSLSCPKATIRVLTKRWREDGSNLEGGVVPWAEAGVMCFQSPQAGFFPWSLQKEPALRAGSLQVWLELYGDECVSGEATCVVLMCDSHRERLSPHTHSWEWERVSLRKWSWPHGLLEGVWALPRDPWSQLQSTYGKSNC